MKDAHVEVNWLCCSFALRNAHYSSLVPIIYSKDIQSRAVRWSAIVDNVPDQASKASFTNGRPDSP